MQPWLTRVPHTQTSWRCPAPPWVPGLCLAVLSGLQCPSWQLWFHVALLLHVVCLLQEPLSLLVTDIQSQRHLLENTVHTNLYHTEEKQFSPGQRVNAAHVLWGLLSYLLKMKLFEHADTGFIFLTNLSFKFGDPQVSHSCKRNQKCKHF